MSQPWDYIAKVVNIGDSAAGKTSLTIRLCEGRFQSTHNVTIGVDFGSRIIPLPPVPFPSSTTIIPTDPTSTSDPSSPPPPPPIPNTIHPPGHIPKIKLQIWDTAGQETFRSITRSYFRGSSAAILVYDITRRQTFHSLPQWLHEVRKSAADDGEDISVILVGNKRDLVLENPEKREVKEEEARQWARENGIGHFVETSAKSGEGVEEAFVQVAREIYDRIVSGKVVVGGKSGVKSAPGVRGGAVRIDEVGGGKGGCC